MSRVLIGNFKGAKGDKGEKGEKGEQGPRGLQGIQGAKGEKGEKGDTGLQGIQGIPGPMGLTGQVDANTPITFQVAASRAGIQSGDSLETAFGKLAKFCSDTMPHAFVSPVNNLTGTDARYPLAAPMGKELKRLNDDLSDKLEVKEYTSKSEANGFTSTALVQGNVVTFKIRGTATVSLGTGGDYAYCGTFTQLKPLITRDSSKIKRAIISTGIIGQVRFDSDTCILRIGFTHDYSGKSVPIPAGTVFYLEETFVL